MQNIGIHENDDFIALSPFTSAEGRDWPLSEAQKLVQMIQEKYHLPVVLIGNKDKDVSKVSEYSLLKKTSIIQLIEVIRRSRCLISPDSGPIHIAGALNVPCVALFSRDLPSRWHLNIIVTLFICIMNVLRANQKPSIIVRIN